MASTSTSGNDNVRCELDSHADTCVVGDSTALVINDYERPTRVFGYDGTSGENGLCKVVSAVVALWDSNKSSLELPSSRLADG